MSQKRFPEEFKIEAVKQITQRGHSVAEVSARLGVSQHSLYKWIKEQQLPPGQHKEQLSQTEELRRLKAELRWVSEERDILKKAALDSTGHCNAAVSVSAGQLYPKVFRGLPFSLDATSLSCSWL
jgi:transposase